VGAYGGKGEIMAMMAPQGPIYQAGTLSGNPLAMAAGIKTLEIIERPGFYESLNRNATRFFTQTQAFITENGLPLSVNFVNSMGCLFFHKSKIENYRDALKCDTDKYSKYFDDMLKEGIYLAPSQYEAMFISAAHTSEDLEQTLGVMKKVLLEL
jgi:glutamate-1-semialdehyde 2,1-aminomutase